MNAAANVDTSPLAWAKRLRKSELEGARLSPAQRAAWRSALKGAPKPTLMAFEPINPAALPPAMREGASA